MADILGVFVGVCHRPRRFASSLLFSQRPKRARRIVSLCLALLFFRDREKEKITKKIHFTRFIVFRVPKEKKGDRFQTPDMCVISKNYLLYVKRQIHGW